jgi:hypothetical protein
MNNELERTEKEVAEASLRVLNRNCLVGTENKQAVPPELAAGVLTTQ